MKPGNRKGVRTGKGGQFASRKKERQGDSLLDSNALAEARNDRRQDLKKKKKGGWSPKKRGKKRISRNKKEKRKDEGVRETIRHERCGVKDLPSGHGGIEA